MCNYKNIVSAPGSPHLSSSTRKAEVETSFSVPKRENKTGNIDANRNAHLKNTLKTKSNMMETLSCQQLLFLGAGSYNTIQIIFVILLHHHLSVRTIGMSNSVVIAVTLKFKWRAGVTAQQWRACEDLSWGPSTHTGQLIRSTPVPGIQIPFLASMGTWAHVHPHRLRHTIKNKIFNLNGLHFSTKKAERLAENCYKNLIQLYTPDRETLFKGEAQNKHGEKNFPFK